MDGIDYFDGKASEPMGDVALLRTIGRGLLLTVASAVLTLSVLAALHKAGAGPLFADETFVAPIAW